MPRAPRKELPQIQFADPAEGRAAGITDPIWAPQPGPQTKVLLSTCYEILFGGSKGGGKGSALSAKVITPFGERLMADIKVGSIVSNPAGGAAAVIAVTPLGRRKIYKFRFNDGAETRVTDDHLWLARITARKSKQDLKYFPFRNEDSAQGKIYTTLQLKDHLEQFKGVERDEWGNGAPGILIPLTRPVEFCPGQAAKAQIVDPYFLGLLIGDGCVSGSRDCVTVSTIDEEIVNSIRAITGYNVTWDNSDSARIVGANKELIADLGKLGLWGKLAHEKNIPSAYLRSSIATRWALVQGLMDTDGYVDSRGHCSYTTVSEQLAEDFQWVCRSLGFKATITSKQGGYRSPDGDLIECRVAYTVYLQGRNTENLFRLTRKKDRCVGTFNGPEGSRGSTEPMRRIVSIEEDGEEEAQCIAVDHPNQLYITDGFVVTHNSEGGRGWLLKGNPRKFWRLKKHPKPADISYINHPDYRALVLRRNRNDLNDWVGRARALYCKLGAEWREKDSEFVFPSGARFLVNHLADESAYFKYEGNEIHRLLIEEVTHIPSYKLYADVKKNIRSTVEQLRPQILLTTNPPGPGMSWVKKRFVTLAPPETVMMERQYNEYTGKEDKITRVYIPARLTDNKILMEKDPGYLTRLKADLSSDEDVRAYLYGDWDALAGGYFKKFRRDKHVVPAESIEIKPWYHRWVSMDWGYRHKTVVYWFAQLPTGQIIIYREKVLEETTPDDAGESVAMACLPDLNQLPGMSMTIFAPPEFIGRRNEASQSGQTFGEMFANGVGRVIGPTSATLLENKEAVQNFFAQQRLQNDSTLIVRGGYNKRVEGWQYMRSLMRTEHLPSEKPPEFDMAFATRLVRENRQEDYKNYTEVHRKFKPVVLPRLLVSDSCELLLKAIPTAVYDDDGEDVQKQSTDEDDALDACRIGCAAHKFQIHEEPYQEFLNRRLDLIQETHGSLSGAALVFANRKAEEDWDNRHDLGGPVSFDRPWGRGGPEREADEIPLSRFLQ